MENQRSKTPIINVVSVLLTALIIVFLLFFLGKLLSSADNLSDRTVSVYVIDSEGNKVDTPLRGKPGTRIAIEDVEKPEKEGFRFSDWYYDEELLKKFTDQFIFLNNDFDLYAKMYKEYKIEYVSNESGFTNHLQNLNTVIEKDTFKLQAASLTGFSFMYWEYNGKKIETIENITANIALNALFTPIINQTTISFDLKVEDGSGEDILSITDTPGSSINLPLPVKQNYQFDGWYTDANLTSKYGGGNIQPLSDITLYANFLIERKVTFSTLASGSVNWNNNLQVITSKDVILLNLPSLDNHNFIHFTVDGTVLLNNTLENIIKDTNVVAVFAEINPSTDPVDVDFNVTGFGNILPTLSGLPGSRLNLPTFETELNKRFSGWYLDITLITPYLGGNTFPQSDLTLYGALVSEFTISYSSSEVSFIHNNRIVFINEENFNLEPAFKSGFEFNNWTIDGSVVTEVDGSLYNADISIIANFTKTINAPISTKIMFIDNGSLVNSIDVEYNQKPMDHANYPINPVITGMTFKFWSMDRLNEYDVSNPIAIDENDFILYSVYELNDIHLKFVGKDGLEIVGAPRTVKYGMQLSNLPVAPIIYNHMFLYYIDLISGNQVDLLTIFEIENDASTPLVITANYAKTKVDVVLMVDDLETSTLNGEPGKIMNLIDPTKLNHRFTGWFTDANLTVNYDGGKTFPQNDTILYGKFVIEYKISYSSSEAGFIHNNRIVFINEENFSLEPAFKTGFEFNNWTIDGNVVTEIDGSLYNADINVIAKFTKTINAPTSTKIMFIDKGSLVSTIDVEYNQKPIDHANYPTAPTSAGKTFKFWSIDTEFEYNVSNPIAVNARDFILYSVYDLNDVHLKFVGKDGLEIIGAPKTVKYGKQLSDLPVAPIVYNHIFLHYADFDNGYQIDIKTIYEIENDISNPLILTANYAKTKVDVVLMVDDLETFTLNGEPGNVMNLVDPMKLNHFFTGWFTNSSLTIKYDGGKTFPKSDSVLYGQFIEEFPITYSSLQNGFINSNPTTILLGEIINLKPANLDKYIFKHWQVDGVIVTSLTGSQALLTKTVEAIFEPVIKETFTISYELKLGGINTNLINNYNEDSNSFTLDSPTHPGYAFKHWEIDGDIVTGFVPKDHLKNVEIVAVYEVATVFTLTYLDNKGLLLYSTNPSNYTYESDFVLIDGKLAGYTFVEWVLDGTIITKIASGTFGNITIVGRLQVKTYKITYDLSDGNFIHSGNPAQYTINDGLITLNPATSLGYYFLGFQVDGTTLVGNQLNVADYLVDITIIILKGTTISYDITFLTDGTPEPLKNYTIEESVILPLDNQKNGYNFVKWVDQTGKAVTEVKLGSSGNLYFNAVFSLAKYKVTYYSDSTTEITSSNYSIGIGLVLDDRVAVPDTHKKFVDWYDNPIFTGLPITKILETDYGDKKVYAKFDDILYNVTINSNGGLVNGVNEVTIPLKYGTNFSTIPTSELSISLPNSTNYPGTYSDDGFWYDNINYLTLSEEIIGKTIYLNWAGQFEYKMLTNTDYYTIVGFASLQSLTSKVVIPSFRYKGIETLRVAALEEDLTTFLGSFPFYVNTAVIADRFHTDSIIISEGIKYITDSAFKNVILNGPFSLVFPNSLELIGRASFSGIENVSMLTFGNNLKTIQPYAFDITAARVGPTIENLIFPASLETMGNSVFNNRPIKNVDLSLTKLQVISSMSFAKISTEVARIENVLLPSHLVSIESNAFIYNSITKVVLPNSLKTIGASAFRYSQISSIVFANPLIENDLTHVHDNAFLTNQLIGFTLDFSKSKLVSLGQGAFGDVGEISTGLITKVLMPRNMSVALAYASLGRHNVAGATPAKTELVVTNSGLQAHYLYQYGSIYTVTLVP